MSCGEARARRAGAGRVLAARVRALSLDLWRMAMSDMPVDAAWQIAADGGSHVAKGGHAGALLMAAWQIRYRSIDADGQKDSGTRMVGVHPQVPLSDERPDRRPDRGPVRSVGQFGCVSFSAVDSPRPGRAQQHSAARGSPADHRGRHQHVTPRRDLSMADETAVSVERPRRGADEQDKRQL